MNPRNEDETPTAETPGEVAANRKGHATRSRKEAEAARRRPLVSGDPKSARKKQRERRNELYALQRQAMETGDPKLEKYLPIRDQGPARSFARDYVDARFSIGELFLPIAFLILIVMMVGSAYPEVALALTAAMYVLVLLGIIDGLALVWFGKRRLAERFTQEQIPRWTGMYLFQRAFMVRRFRMPRPMVKRGQWPHKEGKK